MPSHSEQEAAGNIERLNKPLLPKFLTRATLASLLALSMFSPRVLAAAENQPTINPTDNEIVLQLTPFCGGPDSNYPNGAGFEVSFRDNPSESRPIIASVQVKYDPAKAEIDWDLPESSKKLYVMFKDPTLDKVAAEFNGKPLGTLKGVNGDTARIEPGAEVEFSVYSATKFRKGIKDLDELITSAEPIVSRTVRMLECAELAQDDSNS